MTSDDEGLPITVLEALAQSILVVSSDVGGIPELLEGRGEVISLEDSVKTKLAETLLKVIEVPCKVFETETSNTQRMVEEYIALYMATSENYDSSFLN